LLFVVKFQSKLLQLNFATKFQMTSQEIYWKAIYFNSIYYTTVLLSFNITNGYME